MYIHASKNFWLILTCISNTAKFGGNDLRKIEDKIV